MIQTDWSDAKTIMTAPVNHRDEFFGKNRNPTKNKVTTNVRIPHLMYHDVPQLISSIPIENKMRKVMNSVSEGFCMHPGNGFGVGLRNSPFITEA